MTALVKAIAKADADYRANPTAWTGDKDGRGGRQVVRRQAGERRRRDNAWLPSLADQASPTWLGGGANGGAAKALTETAKFLKDEGRVHRWPPTTASRSTRRSSRSAMK
jgi:taurine transport system substrate-binding protein